MNKSKPRHVALIYRNFLLTRDHNRVVSSHSVEPPSSSGIRISQLQPPTPHYPITYNILTMSQSASPYPTQASFYSTPPMPNSAFNSDTPPPPPPKPSSHEASRGGTPQTTSSIPPPQPTQPGYTSDAQHAEQSISHQTSLPAPPTPEEGWLPDIVKDKS